jgi:2-hydroxy-3-keto-5-methylthiopentenyl-1-phosphate phosphatase
MIIIDTAEENTLELSVTLCDEIQYLILFLSKHTEGASGHKIDIIKNGVDIRDYYHIKIIFDKNSDYVQDKSRTIDFIRSLPQESNFDGIRENEYWISMESIQKYEYENNKI